MSIWSTIVSLEPCRVVGYGPGDATKGGVVDVASAVPWYGGNGLRLSVLDAERPGDYSEVLIDRSQAQQIVDGITAWMAATGQ